MRFMDLPVWVKVADTGRNDKLPLVTIPAQ
jgi:hypothetical protein